ncbi:hypothetical protein [Sphingomonas bacterium]|uniref:hypothetical protein n=1 Tax=Sphingomonas bacterium TaxID=1895847 RepID=UPI002628E150|nr:hypothetical protein [Sphingomonas bacterium]MDB5678983.1 hypothetical protein [Sphingomonas bacterium]
MIQVDMTAPATLCRTTGDSSASRSGKVNEAVAVAHGPFVIMAHGYLAQPLAKRSAFWIRSAQRNVMPAEIEETMRRWHDRSNGADQSRGAIVL